MKTLHIVMGPPASGKTIYGKKLARELGAAFIDSDTATEPVIRAGLKLAKLDPDDRDSPLYRSTFREPAYDCLFDIASENLPQVDVVVAGPFTNESRDPDWIETLEARFHTDIKVHYVTCDIPTRKMRMISRGEPRDRAKLADWDNFIAYYTDKGVPLFPHHLFDTSFTSSE